MKRPLVAVVSCYTIGLLLGEAFQPPLTAFFAISFFILALIQLVVGTLVLMFLIGLIHYFAPGAIGTFFMGLFRAFVPGAQ